MFASLRLALHCANMFCSGLLDRCLGGFGKVGAFQLHELLNQLIFGKRLTAVG